MIFWVASERPTVTPLGLQATVFLLLSFHEIGVKYCDELACLSVPADRRESTHGPKFTKFLCMLILAVVWSSSGGVAIL